MPAHASVMCGIQKGTEELPSGDAATIMEKDTSVWQVLRGEQPVNCRMGMTTGDFFGNGNLVGADDYTGTDGSQPDNQVYYNIWAGRTSNYSNGITECVRSWSRSNMMWSSLNQKHYHYLERPKAFAFAAAAIAAPQGAAMANRGSEPPVHRITDLP